MMMIPEKPKRKRKSRRGSVSRIVLIMLMAVPMTFFVMHPAVGQSLMLDGIALSVMILSAVYLVQQVILYLIAQYTGYIEPVQIDD